MPLWWTPCTINQRIELTKQMKKVYSVKDIDELHRSGGLGSIPANAVITPSARDRLNELGVERAKRAGGSPARAVSSSAGPVDDRGIVCRIGLSPCLDDRHERK